ncbi:MAG: sigma-70 family RNA polymerase sigma factor [Sporichthyaceae bacterium]
MRTADVAEAHSIQACLVLRYAELARDLAAHCAASDSDVDELRQVGLLALIMAIRSFDPGRGPSLSSYATPIVRGEIQRHLRGRGPFGAHPAELPEHQIAEAQRRPDPFQVDDAGKIRPIT